MARVIPHLNLTHDLSRFVNAPLRRTARTDTGSTPTTSTPQSTDAAADFRALFNGGFSTPTNNAPPPPPTAESVFGPNPWVANPTAMGPTGETVGYNPEQSVRGGSPKLKTTERFTRVAPDRLHYAFNVEDPDTWVEPWGGEYEFAAVAGHVYEYACHEGNYGLTGILAGGREADRLKATPGK